MQNRVAQHQLGIAIGTMSFARSLFTTMMVALLGTIVLSTTSAITPGTGGEFGGAPPPGAAEAALAFSRAFFVVLACLAASFVALVLLEEQPLRTGIAPETKTACRLIGPSVVPRAGGWHDREGERSSLPCAEAAAIGALDLPKWPGDTGPRDNQIADLNCHDRPRSP